MISVKARLLRIGLLIGALLAFVTVAFAGATLTASMATFQVSCIPDAGGVAVTDSTIDGYNSLRCWNGSVSGGTATENTDVVCMGGSDVDVTTNCYPICATSAGCPESALTVDATVGAGLYCRSASGATETITCIAGR